MAAATLVAGCSGAAHSPLRPLAAPQPAVTSSSTTTAPSTTTVAPSTTTTSAPPTTTATTAASSTTTAPAPRPAAVAQTPACPTNLAEQLSSTGSAGQLVTVTALGWETSSATVELWQKRGSCWTPVAGPWPAHIGSTGFSNDKTEGDGTTPTGLYGVGPVIYGNAPDPGVHEPYVHLVDGDWWDEDPTSAQYNQFEYVPPGATPPGGGSEALWKETAAYPSFAVIDYNTAPVVPYKGSAIFFHADVGSATAGCVSVPLADLDWALDWFDPSLHPVFVMGPAQEIRDF